jgi:competence protein ComEA
MDDGAWRQRAETWWAERPPTTQGLLLLVAAALAGTAVLSRLAAPGAAPVASLPPAVSDAPLLIHVAGEVVRPGLYRLAGGARVADALAAAGGATERADLAAVNLARVLEDGEQLVVPGPAPPGAPPGAREDGKVDLNRASAAELDALPGIGPVLASRIVAYRDAHGGFGSVRDLRRVQGIGDKLYRSLAELVAV